MQGSCHRAFPWFIDVTHNHLTLEDALRLAAAHLQSGNYPAATEVCTQILQVAPDQADALHFLGLMAANQGRAADALSFLQRAVAARNDDFELHNNLGNLYKVLGDLELAHQCYVNSVGLNPDSFPARFNLGLVLSALNRYDEAILSYREAIALEPDVGEAYYNLGLALRQVSEPAAAIESFQKAIQLQPEYIEPIVSLGACLAESGHLDEAVKVYRSGLALNQQHGPLYNNLGVALTAQGNYSEARTAFWQALQSSPDSVEARNNLGVVERLLGNLEQALDAFKLAAEANPNFFQAYRNLGQCLADLGQYQQAILAFRQSLQINPAYYEAKLELAMCYASIGESEQALQYFSDAQAMFPTSIVPIWGAAMAALPNFYETEDEILEARTMYTNALDVLAEGLNLESLEALADAASAVAFLLPFFLTYQPLNNKELQQKHGELARKVLHAQYAQWAVPLTKPTLKEGDKIRVGIVSRHFSNHSDWKVLTAGILQGLDGGQFEIVAYSTGGAADAITAQIRKEVKSFVQGLGFEQLCQRIHQDGLHVLIFPEVGMDPTTFKIASLRLAPIQCAAWARPETSGVPTIDYFLSGALMEPPNAESHYSEKLIRLPNLFSYYAPQPVEANASRLFDLGVRKDATRYACVQSLFKYLPQHDAAFVRIAKAIPDAQFIFVAKPADVADKLQARLNKAFEASGMDASKHLTFLPLLGYEEFVALLRESHVFLDSIGYSGCLTTLDAFEADLPVVTMSGDFMRGRQSAAMLGVLGLNELVAQDLDGYVALAARLGQDQSYRNAISQQIKEKRYFLYRDYEAMNGLQEWLKSVVRS